MTVYAETSAILSWLFGEEEAGYAMDALDRANAVVTSALSIIECRRALLRAEAGKLVSAADGSRLLGILTRTFMQWTILEVTPVVRERAGQRFPVEPVRSLDAIHLSSALTLLHVHPDLRVLSVDERLVANLQPLGLERA